MTITKDRLADLKNNINYNIENESHSPPHNSLVLEDSFQETFAEIVKIRQWIDDIDLKTKSIIELYKNPACHMSKEIQNEIDANVIICSALGFKVSGALGEFHEKVANIDKNNTTLWRIAHMQHATMKQLFINILAAHEDCLKKYKESKLSLLREQMKLTNQEISEEECASLIEANKLSMFVDNLETETREAKLALRDLESRHKELIKIENALVEVKKLFVEMAGLINKQQNVIDTIEYYATQAQDHVVLGNKEIVKGSKNMKKGLKKKIYLTICLATGCTIVLAVLILT